MTNSQDFDQSSNSPLTKLLEVDSELAVQEAELLSHLESVQEKRKSLETVISMFTKVDTSANAPVEVAQTQPVETNLAALPPVETSKATATAESGTEAAANTEFNGAKKTASSSNPKSKTTKFTQKAKAAKRASGWQHYVRDEFSNSSLPEAVYAVLQRHADKVFEIPSVVHAIFVDDLPSDVGSKARRQVTNILSEGARKKKWYRGQLGYYSMSRAAAEVKS